MRNSENGAVFISGTSSGIGKATALLLDRKGFRVFAGVRKEADAERLRTESNGRLTPVIVDITVPDQREEVRRLVTDEVGSSGLAGLINNAGIALAGPLEYLSLEEFTRHLDVNLIGHLAMTQLFLPLIRQGKGRIINVASANCRFAFPFLGAYVTSKFGLRGMTDSLRMELRPWNIPVILVEPGTVEAPIWDNAGEATEKLIAGLSEEARQRYEKTLSEVAAFMNKGRDVALHPNKIAEIIHKALSSMWPRNHYRRGPGSHMSLFGSILPTRLTDWVVINVIKGKLTTKLVGW